MPIGVAVLVLQKVGLSFAIASLRIIWTESAHGRCPRSTAEISARG